MKFYNLLLGVATMVLCLERVKDLPRPPTIAEILEFSSADTATVVIEPVIPVEVPLDIGEDTIVVESSYAQRVNELRLILDSLFIDAEPFVRENVVLFGPKFILGCEERGFQTPGERFAQCLLESSKLATRVVDIYDPRKKKWRKKKIQIRVWSSLTQQFHNFGGVKARKGHKSTPHLATHEIISGQRKTVHRKFTASDNKWDGLDVYLDVLDQPRYKSAMKHHGRAHFYALARAGYCTENADTYADKCVSVMKRHGLQRLNQLLIP